MTDLITIIKIIQQDAHHYLLQLSNGEEIMVHEDILVRYRLLSGKEIEPQLLTTLEYEGEVQQGYIKAINYISYRPRSTFEVKQYLLRKQVAEQSIADILNRLTEQRYLDDAQFAQKWIENRQLLKPKGKYALQAELKEKGIAADIIQDALSTLDMDRQMEQAEETARKKMRQIRDKEWKDARLKLMRFLSYKGYEMDIIHQVIAKLESEFHDLA